MNMSDAVVISTIGGIVASLLGFILSCLLFYWLVKMAVLHAGRRLADEAREYERRARSGVTRLVP